MNIMEHAIIQDDELRQLLGALTALKKGDSSVR